MASVLRVQGVTWRREEQEILHGIEWQVEQGEHWCVLGCNGSGKTTLLQMIVGYIWPTKGQVEVLGNVYGACLLQEVRKQIGWVSNSLVERLSPGLPASHLVISGKYGSLGLYEKWGEQELAEAEQVMRELGIASLADKLWGQLSQGQQQKVLIARALMNRPKLLILDEPGNGLDLLAREQLLQMINRLGQDPDGPTIVYVTHHIEEIVPTFTHVLLFGQGEVLASGRKEDVLTNEYLSRAYQLPLHVEWQSGRPWVKVVGEQNNA